MPPRNERAACHSKFYRPEHPARQKKGDAANDGDRKDEKNDQHRYCKDNRRGPKPLRRPIAGIEPARQGTEHVVEPLFDLVREWQRHSEDRERKARHRLINAFSPVPGRLFCYPDFHPPKERDIHHDVNNGPVFGGGWFSAAGHWLMRLNSTTHTHGFCFQDSGPLMDCQRERKDSTALSN